MVFEPALDEMEEHDSPIYGPTSFRDYVSTHDLEVGPRTPRYISIDSIAELATELLDADVMAFRMGSAATGSGTQFLLVKAPDHIEEFFLIDDDVFDDENVPDYQSPVDEQRLLSFHLLPTLSETSLVNLALASGVLSDALELDETGSLMPPATGRSTFTFDVRPHSTMDATFEHRTGQVEIDTLFAEKRNGETVLFVIEAKTGLSRSSLAKHKLVYPTLALANSVPSEIDILPLYMRCLQEDDQMYFKIVECEFPDPRETLPGLDELEGGDSVSVRLNLDDASK